MLAAHWGVLKVERGRFYQQFGETSRSGSGEAGSARQFVTDLDQRRRINVGDIKSYYDIWVNAIGETAGDVPREVTQTLKNVSLGLGFLFYNRWGEMGYEGRSKQVAFQKRLQRWHEEYKGQLVLTYEQGQMLRDAAAAVNVAYDPGGVEDTPENRKKRTFVFADLERIPAVTATVVDAEK